MRSWVAVEGVKDQDTDQKAICSSFFEGGLKINQVPSCTWFVRLDEISYNDLVFILIVRSLMDALLVIVMLEVLQCKILRGNYYTKNPYRQVKF